MAETNGTTDPGIGGSGPTPRICQRPAAPRAENPTYADLVLSLVTHEDYFVDVNEFPEADVRQRYLHERCMRAQYVEWWVMDRRDAWRKLLDEVRTGKSKPDDEEYKKRHAIIAHEVDEALSWSSRVNEEDSKAANAPVVDPHFMKHFRYILGRPGKGSRAPNSMLSSTYGSVGDPVPRSVRSLKHCNDGDFFRRLILDKLMTPFNHKIFIPLQRFYNKRLGRRANLQPQALNQKTLDVLAMVFECVVAIGCFAGPVAMLYKLSSTNVRLVAGTFASFICLLPAIFLSKDAMKISMLLAAIWSFMFVVVFLSDENCHAKSG